MKPVLKLFLLPLVFGVSSLPGIPETPATVTETAVTPSCKAGALTQGGLLLCHGEPGTLVRMNGSAVAKFDETGRASVGLQQHSPTSFTITLQEQGTTISEDITIAERNDEYRTLTGLDCDKVDARTQEQKDHAGRSWVKKQDAWVKFNDGPGFFDGAIKPAEGPTSSPFGPTRKYTGVSKTSGESCESTSVHRGQDFATPVGTPVVSPADGVIILADPDLYYEGGSVFVDHGQGLISVFMHLSSVDVEDGQVVTAGQQIAKTGNTGRTTGPHLHWAIKWRNTASDNRGDDFYIDPALLMDGLKLPG
ncbi:MAG: peptidase M23 [Ponticaulis sp.]|nr:peptidase M23 [Ponticaulis sp.]